MIGAISQNAWLGFIYIVGFSFAVWLGATFVAPFRQRNEARDMVGMYASNLQKANARISVLEAGGISIRAKYLASAFGGASQGIPGRSFAIAFRFYNNGDKPTILELVGVTLVGLGKEVPLDIKRFDDIQLEILGGNRIILNEEDALYFKLKSPIQVGSSVDGWFFTMVSDEASDVLVCGPEIRFEVEDVNGGLHAVMAKIPEYGVSN